MGIQCDMFVSRFHVILMITWNVISTGHSAYSSAAVAIDSFQSGIFVSYLRLVCTQKSSKQKEIMLREFGTKFA